MYGHDFRTPPKPSGPHRDCLPWCVLCIHEKRVADHFGVSVDSLVGNTSVAPVSDIISVGISAEEIELLRAYRAHPEMQAAVNRLLGIKEAGGAYMYTAAHSTDKHCDAVTYVDKEALIRLEEAPQTDDTLM